MKDIKFSKSKAFKSEYSCSVVKIGELIPIENSDLLAKTLIQGIQIIVRKDQVKTGDIMIYASNETQLNPKFLSVNNLYDLSNREKNKNYKELEKILEPFTKEIKPKLEETHKKIDLLKKNKNKNKEEIKKLKEEIQILVKQGEPTLSLAKKKCGFFDKHGRVRCITLRGEISFGFLFSPNELYNFDNSITLFDIESYLNQEFDTIGKELFCKVYVPQIKEKPVKDKKLKKVKKFDRLEENSFEFHYETQQLQKFIYKIKPDDVVTCSVKLHGTSIIIGKVPVRYPKKIAIYKRIINFFYELFRKSKKFIDYTVDLGPIYSSRTVVRNRYIIKKDLDLGYYDEDIWSDWGGKIYPYLEDNITIYGEIIGVLENGKEIQQGYDYNCGITNKLMIYRVTKLENGIRKEYNPMEVLDWTYNLIAKMEDNNDLDANRIHPIDILYHGTLRDLYPNLDINNHWNENVLEEMKKDEKHFGMELDEPLCMNKVPREGIVLRIENDPIHEAFKLKCQSFLKSEAKLYDSDTYVDVEVNN